MYVLPFTFTLDGCLMLLFIILEVTMLANILTLVVELALPVQVVLAIVWMDCVVSLVRNTILKCLFWVPHYYMANIYHK